MPVMNSMIDSNGWLYSLDYIPLRIIPSPNFNQRPCDAEIRLLVIHNISLPPNQFGGGYIEQLFCNQLPPDQHPYFEKIAHVEVSSHILIDRQGVITQFVSFDQRAWHAGQSQYQGCDNCNDFSIGVELEGSDTEPFTDVQYWRLEWLTRLLMDHYDGLEPENIVGHEHISPGRKTDPGPYFDWRRYKRALTA